MKRAGWVALRQRGSHLHLVHPDKPGRRVTVSIHAREILLPKTLETLLEQADMSVEQFRGLM